jgi:pSer/pThr/pTyr-binding forkhead associated (FHA) protein
MNVNLVLFKKDGSTRSFKLPSTVTTIGRRKDCDLCIPLSCISRRHCEFDIDKDRLTLRDLNSKNGTFLNGSRISESLVKPGDMLKIGTLSFGIQIDGRPEDIESMRPADIPAKAKPTERQMIRADDSFEKMIDEFSDFDLNQTLGESSMGMNS